MTFPPPGAATVHAHRMEPGQEKAAARPAPPAEWHSDPWDERNWPKMERAGFPGVVVDTREQLPYFAGHPWAHTGTLHTGDYSVRCYEDEFALERKSVSDLYSSIIQSRRGATEERDEWMSKLAADGLPRPPVAQEPRFRGREERKCQRLGRLWRACYVVEGTWADVLDPTRRDPEWCSQADPRSIAGTLHAWEGRYGVAFHCVGRREEAERWAWAQLYHWWRVRVDLEQAVTQATAEGR